MPTQDTERIFKYVPMFPGFAGMALIGIWVYHADSV